MAGCFSKTATCANPSGPQLKAVMRPIILLCLVLALPGCARLRDSAINPANWLGPPPASDPETRPLMPGGRGVTVLADARPAVAEVTALAVEHLPGGAIVRATGTVPSQGWFNAELVRLAVTDGVLIYEFRAEPPASAVGAPASITAADSLTAAELASIRAVRVQAAGSALQAGR